MNEDNIIDLGAIAFKSARGKTQKDIGLTKLRSLTHADIEAIENSPPKGADTPAILRVRAPHQRLAKLLSDGIPQNEVSAITGYSQSRISTLLKDPTFNDLIEYYKTQKDQIYLETHEKLAALGTNAVEVIQDRLLANEEDLTTAQLLEIAEFALDRSIAPKKGGNGNGGGSNGNNGGGNQTTAIKIEFVNAAQKELPPPKMTIIEGEFTESEIDEAA